MSKGGAEEILNARMAETRRQKEEAAAAKAAAKEARDTYVIEPPADSPSRTSRAFGVVNDYQREANVATGLRDPRLATWLYIAVVATAAMFSKKWGTVSKAVVAGTKK